MIGRKESFDLLEKVVPVGIEGEQWMIEVCLKNAVRTVHRAVGDSIDYIVPAADMIGSPWTGLQTPSVKMSDEQIFFAGPDRIGHRRKLFDERPLVLDGFHGNIG